MHIKIKLNIDEIDNYSSFLDSDIELSINQLYNLATYLEQMRKHKDILNSISDQNEIKHAINYDSDDNNNYWIILDKNYKFLEVGIPHCVDLDNDKIYDNLKDLKNIIKLLNKKD